MARKRKSPVHRSVPSFMVTGNPLVDHIRQRNPYIAAHDAFVGGLITVSQAIAMVVSDRDFIAEATMRCDGSVFDNAERVVRQSWAPELVARIQDRKREAA